MTKWWLARRATQMKQQEKNTYALYIWEEDICREGVIWIP